MFEVPQFAPPVFGGRRLLYVATGSLSAMFTPMWLHWIRENYPDVDLKVVITPSTTNFTGLSALTMMGRTEVIRDVWPESPSTAIHVELAEWADSVIVHPATFSFISRLAVGLADSPAMLALQCTGAPIAIAPALPGGGAESPAHRRHLQLLKDRPNITVVPGTKGISATTGRLGPETPAQIQTVVAMLEKVRLRLEMERS
ncbi:flavoprotein [Streptomyces sp. ISL-11]|uniref:flavoprotein n=1 Tax=Streptomyces sp. ISL-11 TaxID=2819174 RepID=UPI001BE55073|nr:flavoprotein [Streptomyces sp. ISL-11]MBT2386690.1 flavoprotein [Streptomyces sp. ISL-11]